MTNVVVIPRDLPAAGLCVEGAKEWMNLNGLSFRAFMREGLPVDVVRQTGCPLGEQACVAAELRTAEELSSGR